MQDGTEAGEPLRGPVCSRVRYDDGVLSTSWSTDSGSETTFRVYVFEDEDQVAEVDAGSATHMAVPAELERGSHEVAVREFAGGTARRWSARVPVVVGSVAVDRADTDPVSGTTTLHWTAGQGDEFLVRMEVNGAPAGPDRAAVGESCTLTQPPPGATAMVSLARIVRRHGAVSVGPRGPRFALPTRPPELLTVDVDAGRLSVEWTAVPGVDGYRVSVLSDGQVSFQDTAVASATSLDLTPPGITGRLAHAVVVQAIGPGGSGPASVPVPIVPSAPVLTAVRSDGSGVWVDVAPPPGPAPASYALALLRNGLLLRETTLGPAATLALALPGELTPGAVYTVAVRARSGRSTGPAATGPALLTAPTVSSVACRADLVVAAESGSLPAGTAMEARLRVDGVPGDPRPLSADASAVFPVPDGAVSVSVRGVQGIATGPWSEPVAALTRQARFTVARVEQDRVSLAWEGRRGATFLVTAGGPGTVTGARTAELPLHGETATIAEVAGVATGPVTTVALPTNAVRITYGSVDAGRRVTLRWTGGSLPLMTGVQPVVRWADNTLELDAARVADPVVFTLPDEVPGTATVALRAISPLTTGPLGNAIQLLTVAPTGLTAEYDGAVVTATWDPIPVPVADRYSVTLSRPGTADIVVTAAGPRARMDLRLQSTASAAPTVTVAAMAGSIARGLPTAPVPVFTETLFPGRSSLAPQRGPVSAPADITLGLPELFTAPQTAALALPLGFTLAPGGSAAHAYTLRIPAGSPVWDFTSRTDVIAQWTALLSRLEQSGITSYGVAALSEAVSRSMPQTFAETLYFAYGLRFDRGCFDLRPGMVLRVEYENYQVAPGQQSNVLSGFVTTAVADYEVASLDRAGRRSAGLDAFLNSLTQQAVVVPPPAPPPGGQSYGGGGILDLFAPAMQLPFTRLVYPPEMLQTTSPGSALAQQNAVFLAASTLSALDAATDNVRSHGAPGPAVAAAYLRGRTVVRPMVRVSVDGAPRLVPLGTTLGDLLASEGRRPPAFALPLTGATLRRARAAAVVTSGPAADWPVTVDWAGLDPGFLDLPLLHGDRVGLPGGDRP